MLKAPDKSIKDETADRVNSLSVVPVSVATYSLRSQVAPPTLTLTLTLDEGSRERKRYLLISVSRQEDIDAPFVT